MNNNICELKIDCNDCGKYEHCQKYKGWQQACYSKTKTGATRPPAPFGLLERFVRWRSGRKKRKLFLLACAVLREMKHREIELASEDESWNKARIGIKLIDVHLNT